MNPVNKEDQIAKALMVINHAQNQIWELHHHVKQYNEALAMEIWNQSLQIEHALIELNEALYGKREYL